MSKYDIQPSSKVKIVFKMSKYDIGAISNVKIGF